MRRRASRQKSLLQRAKIFRYIPHVANKPNLRYSLKMAYEVTATRRRPQSFEDLAGQEFVVATLKNAIQTGQIAHAYLFSGPRGCGKTSSARILAKALNCEKGPNVQPCGQCSACREIAKGSSLDVIEIDGASNTSVNDVRQIKDEVLFPPNSLRYKIYIIDEVHMLSTSAFNALLKTIEEPPPYVIFIFATTELHKVPATIKSRCQQFNFRLVAPQTLRNLLADAAAELGIQADDEALYWIARESTGSVRDAYTLFDQVAAFSNGHITYDKIRDKLGLVGIDRLNQLCELCVDGNNAEVLQTLDEILQNGVSIEQFIVNFADYLRSLLLIQSNVTKESLLGQNAGRFSKKVLGAWDTIRLERALSLFLQLFRDVRYSLSPRFELELAVSRLIWLANYVSPAEVKQAVDAGRSLLLPQRGQGGSRPLSYSGLSNAEAAQVNSQNNYNIEDFSQNSGNGASPFAQMKQNIAHSQNLGQHSAGQAEPAVQNSGNNSVNNAPHIASSQNNVQFAPQAQTFQPVPQPQPAQNIPPVQAMPQAQSVQPVQSAPVLQDTRFAEIVPQMHQTENFNQNLPLAKPAHNFGNAAPVNNAPDFSNFQQPEMTAPNVGARNAFSTVQNQQNWHSVQPAQTASGGAGAQPGGNFVQPAVPAANNFSQMPEYASIAGKSLNWGASPKDVPPLKNYENPVQATRKEQNFAGAPDSGTAPNMGNSQNSAPNAANFQQFQQKPNAALENFSQTAKPFGNLTPQEEAAAAEAQAWEEYNSQQEEYSALQSFNPAEFSKSARGFEGAAAVFDQQNSFENASRSAPAQTGQNFQQFQQPEYASPTQPVQSFQPVAQTPQPAAYYSAQSFPQPQPQFVEKPNNSASFPQAVAQNVQNAVANVQNISGAPANIDIENLKDAAIQQICDAKPMLGSALKQAKNWQLAGSSVRCTVENAFTKNKLSSENHYIAQIFSEISGQNMAFSVEIDNSGNAEKQAEQIPQEVDLLCRMFKGQLVSK